MNQTTVPANNLDNFSIGSCIPGQELPTLSCLPALWLAFFAACVFAALGFGLIWIMKLRRCYRMSKGKRDVYFNEFEFSARHHQGGNLGAGTSSIVMREEWVDIEQRAQLYSPNPLAAAFRAKETPKSMFAKREAEEERVVSPEVSNEDSYPLAVPPDWFRELGRSKPGGPSLSGGDDHDRGLMQNRPPSYTLTESIYGLSRKHHHDSIKTGAEPRRRVSLP